MTLGFSGILLVIKGEIPSLTTGIEPKLGLFYGILASFTFALFTVLAKREVNRYGNLLFNTISFIIGAAALLLVSSLFGINLHFSLTGRNLILILYLGLFVTVAAYILYFAGLKDISAATGSMLFFLKPFIASALSLIFLGERIAVIQFAGIFLILGGIYLSQRQETFRNS